jgi:hypothetical protein
MSAKAEISDGRGRPSRLWLWIVVAFVIQAAAWTAWFMIASENRVAEVPLATGGKAK